MKEQFIQVEVGKKQYLPNGVEVIATVVDEIDVDPNPSIQAIAEAKHIVIKPGNVNSAEISGSGGVTRIKSFDPVQAAAHSEGNSHDRRITELQGFNYDSMAVSAEGILSKKEDEVITLAGYLQKRKRITGSEAQSVINRVVEGDKLVIKFKKPNGEVKTIMHEGVKAENGIIQGDLIENEWINFPQAV
jgi:hypothetical protein